MVAELVQKIPFSLSAEFMSKKIAYDLNPTNFHAENVTNYFMRDCEVIIYAVSAGDCIEYNLVYAK